MTRSLTWPTASQASWDAFAAELNARMELIQLHIEPNWLFALCSGCGWDLELDRPALVRFRFEVASHHCTTAVEPLSLELEEMLF